MRIRRGDVVMVDWSFSSNLNFNKRLGRSGLRYETLKPG